MRPPGFEPGLTAVLLPFSVNAFVLSVLEKGCPKAVMLTITPWPRTLGEPYVTKFGY